MTESVFTYRPNMIGNTFAKMVANLHNLQLLTLHIRPKKKIVMLPSHAQNLKIGLVGRFFFLFFIFTYRERVEFSNIFFKVSKWGKLGRNAVKTHIQVLF